MTKAPLSRIFHVQDGCFSRVRFVKDIPGEARELQAIQHKLKPHHIRGHWYAPSPEVVDLIANDGRDVPPAPRTGGRRLDRATTLEIFRAAHETGVAFRLIGERYGVSAIAVGRIARGEVSNGAKGLFVRTPLDARRYYYVYEREREGAPRYKFQVGIRSTK